LYHTTCLPTSRTAGQLRGLLPECRLTLIALSRPAEEHKSEEVMAINPRGQLPAFRDGDVVVNESFAAIIYLEEKYESGTQLLPKDPAARALVRLLDQNEDYGRRCPNQGHREASAST